MTQGRNALSKVPVILITGKNGQVGWELQRSLSHIGKVFAFGRDEMDLSNSDALRQKIREIKPDVIMTAAAYTAVDKAEEEPDLAMQINGHAPGVLAEEAKQLGALLFHYSTDYVFNGEKNSPYIETDIPDPVNEYGKSKLAGEQAIQSVNADYLILRTSWVYASRGHNFMHSMLRFAAEREKLSIVSDQVGAPTSARFIAEVSAQVLWQALSERQQGNFASGLYHLSSSGETSWHGFAKEIIEMAKKILPDTEYKVKEIKPISTKEYPTPAKRPMSSRLSSEYLAKTYGLHLPDWDQLLELCMLELR